MSGKRKASSMDRILAMHGEDVGKTIARRIMESVDGAEAFCPDPTCRGRLRYLKAVENAAIALDVGAGRAPSVGQPPACSSAELAAITHMGRPA